MRGQGVIVSDSICVTGRVARRMFLRAMLAVAIWLPCRGLGNARAELRWSAPESTYTTTGHDTKGYSPRPDDETVKSVQVEWDKFDIDPLDKFCTVRGRLTVADAAQGSRPVDWLQGIMIYTSKMPETTPSWSRGLSERNSVSSTVVVKQSGHFQKRIDLRRLRRDRQLAQRFQFGVALGRHIPTPADRDMIVWDIRAPALAQSVALRTVPAAPELSASIDLIRKASDWPFENHDSSVLIRAVNELQRLGKEPALKELEQYLRFTDGFEYWNEQEIVFWIVRLLFQSNDDGHRLRPPGISVHLEDGNAAEADQWPLKPIAVADDIPFMLGHRINFSTGKSRHPKEDIAWARRHATIRDKPLMPTRNPLEAANALLADHRFLALGERFLEDATCSVRMQALDTAGLSTKQIPADYYMAVVGPKWETVVKNYGGKKVVWDVAGERFRISP